MTATMVIRVAVPADAAALGRLAALDCAQPLRGDALVALVDGEPRAALSLAEGRAIADPFELTAELIELLQTRAAQLKPSRQRRIWRLRVASA